MKYKQIMQALEMFLAICIINMGTIRSPNLYPMYLNTVQIAAVVVGTSKIMSVHIMLGTIVLVGRYPSLYLMYPDYYIMIPWMKARRRA